MSTNKVLREFKRDLSKLNLDVLHTDKSNGHCHVHIGAKDGRELTYTIAGSGSDHRAAVNRISDVRRYFSKGLIR